MFTDPATHCSMGNEVKGAHSLEQYKLIADRHSHLEQLRELGLTEDEIMCVIVILELLHWVTWSC